LNLKIRVEVLPNLTWSGAVGRTAGTLMGKEETDKFASGPQQVFYQFHIARSQIRINGTKAGMLDDIVKLMGKFGRQFKDIALDKFSRQATSLGSGSGGSNSGWGKVYAKNFKTTRCKKEGIMTSSRP
jgi:hypothetical protein